MSYFESPLQRAERERDQAVTLYNDLKAFVAATPGQQGMELAFDEERQDNARLRQLICDAEFGNHAQAVTKGFCPWCQANEGSHFRCSAFTDDGRVR